MNFDMSYKPMFNKALVIVVRRIMQLLARVLPILYTKEKNLEIISEHNNKLREMNTANVIGTMQSTFEYLNALLYCIFKNQTLRETIAKYALPTYNDPNRTPATMVLLLQDDKIPKLIAFGSNGCCINSIFDAIGINYKEKTIDIIPFPYTTLHYVVILKPKNYRDIFLKHEDLLVDNQPHIYRLVMDLIKIIVSVLNLTRSSSVNAQVMVSTAPCSHACNFVRENNVPPRQNYYNPQSHSRVELSSHQPHSATIYLRTTQGRTEYSYTDILNMIRNARNMQNRRFYR